ncbi:MAG: sigma-70 family RNA polymerase sigma factor [Actinomycetes bacterium]|nr:MAG: RNA polymerase sigma factor SigM [Actinomycetota bacterium]
MTTSHQEDAALLARAAAGDHDAFTAVMRAHEDRVFAVCLRMLGDREAALDVTQETFITAFRKAHQFQGNSAVGTWLYRIAVNNCYDWLRRHKRRRAEALPEGWDQADPASTEEVEAAAHRHEIQVALAALPSEYRAAVILSDIEGMALPDVAAALGVPVGTVKSRLFRARRILAERLGEPKG